ncbi:MAG TPA: hypothetical protein VFS94_11280 [Gemmatimonadales bacterium]|nr:hypothetical protein [Gemmatimonadales bacterium]
MLLRSIAALMVLIATPAGGSAEAQSSGSTLVQLTLLPSLAVTGTQDLAFGTVASFSSTTVLARDGGRFTIQGQPNAPVVIEMTQLPPNLAPNLSLDAWTGLHGRAPGAGGATAFAPVPGGSLFAVLHTNGRYFIWLGATLTATGAPPGAHSAPLVITVGYN